MSTLERITIGDHVILVRPEKAIEIRQKIALRQARDHRISQDLRQSGMLPSGSFNQTAKWSGSNYSRHDVRDERVINDTVTFSNDGRVNTMTAGRKAIIETRFAEHLRREWSA